MNGNWIMAANTTGSDSTADIYVQGNKVDTLNVPAYGYAYWQSPTTVTGGPVKVVTTSGMIVSQRVLYKNSFNEVLGVGHSTLTDEDIFTWYDNNAAAGMNGNWIMANNQGSAAANVYIYIHDIGDSDTPVATIPDVAPGQTVFWQSPGVTVDGPVKVTTNDVTAPLIVSQRIVFKDSFEEVQGTGIGTCGDNGNFSWYDSRPAAGMNGDWLLISNYDAVDHDVTIAIDGGNMINPDTGTQIFTVPAGQSIAPAFPNTMAGPVQVITGDASAKLVISQRVIYKDSFNEIVGRPVPIS
jgi:hypothetical protein